MTIYLDHSTSSRLSVATLSKMMPYFREIWGNPTAPHAHGQESLPAIEEAKSCLYKLVGAKSNDRLVFTSSHAEAINHVIMSTYFDVTRQTGTNHYVTSCLDEAPVILAMTRLKEVGCVMQMAPANKEGQITAEAIADVFTPRTALVSMSWACALTGVIHPVEEIAKVCKERGILFHVDATHLLGKGYYNWEGSGADILTFGGEPLHGPKGTGALFVRQKTQLSPFILGGGEQNGLRGGSFNVPAFIGLGSAAQNTLEQCDYMCTEVARLRNSFETTLKNAIPGSQVLFEQSERLPNVSCITFPHVNAEALLFLLSRKSLFASFGGGNFQQLGLLLKASGIFTHGALSFSLSAETTEEEVRRGAELIIETYLRLKKCWEGS